MYCTSYPVNSISDLINKKIWAKGGEEIFMKKVGFDF